jgi:hypothetical protein
MLHLTTHVVPTDYLMGMLEKGLWMLNYRIWGNWSIKGTTDVVIAESKTHNDAVRHCWSLPEKSPRTCKTRITTTDDLRTLGVLSKSCNHGVVSVLTDLNRSWTFYWYAKKNKGGSGVALYKLKLENEGEPARLAKYILKASMSHAGKLFQLLCRPNFVSGCRG